jgi:flagellar biosynthesis protein FlhB
VPGERTEAATPKRRQEARERGQVLKSTEVSTAALLVVGAAFLQWGVPGISYSVVGLAKHTFDAAAFGDLTVDFVYPKTLSLGLFVLRLVGPLLLLLALVSVLSNLAQFGFLLTGKPLQPQLSRINPIEGVKRYFSSRTIVELVKSVVKLSIVGGFAWQAVQDKGPQLVLLADMHPAVASTMVTGMVMSVIWKVAAAFVAIAFLDFLYQRWFYERSLRMSKQDIKEEMKQTEGNPHMRSRLRQRARALARQRMLSQVPQADVVITNPTHYAVAIKFESGMEAPVVIAKGERLIAHQIKKVAREHNVPTVENKPVAQALFKACRVGQAVPPELYKAVAEVLAFVYRLYPHRAPAGYAAA